MPEKSFRIVAVEDDTNITGILNEFAAASDISFHSFSGLDTICIEDLHAADLIFLDLQLDHHDGIDVILALDQNKVKTPIILCSGMDINVINASKDLLTEHGLTCFGQLQKPFSYEQFLEAINAIEGGQSRNVKPSVPTTQRSLSNQDITNALERHWFTAHYQPQIDPVSGKITGVECLARLNHPERGLFNPFEFIQRIKELGLMDIFTKQIIQVGLKELCTAPLPKGTMFSFNLDAFSINTRFLVWLLDCLIEYAIPPNNICLEITELSALEINSEVKSILTKLRIRGFSLSLDDFGTGFSTIQELNELPFNEVKIDRSFVTSMLTKDSSEAIVRSTIDLAKRLSYRVVAEGAETSEQVIMLKQFGCHDIQGFYYCKPKSIEQFILFCENQAKGIKAS
ncbi:EAL domain-containing protein [Alteromonas sp. ASW11-36]|uniref:EAL domain-containing protein n=1 Tax=Alteromonas arenosi TaxID=3055817 RepID=A0ABT7T0Y9_9ALTE|nr:EAL domain-containing response regulator [Alteromonas sp. ASW11-36]MDM7861889.1 EAL domain-containing protein [Alteromonas sp. ASW11-36]